MKKVKVDWKRLALASAIPVAVVAFVWFLPELAFVLLLLATFSVIAYLIYEHIGLCYGKIKIKLDGGMMPKKANPFDAAYDVYVPEDFDLKEGRQVIDLGFALEMPHGMGAFIRARSGFLAKGIEAIIEYYDGSKESIRLDAVTPTGLIDCGYRNNLGAVVWMNPTGLLYKRIYIPKGTRICQMQFIVVPDTELIEVAELDMTDDRGGGFGHTNKYNYGKGTSNHRLCAV